MEALIDVVKWVSLLWFFIFFKRAFKITKIPVDVWPVKWQNEWAYTLTCVVVCTVLFFR